MKPVAKKRSTAVKTAASKKAADKASRTPAKKVTQKKRVAIVVAVKKKGKATNYFDDDIIGPLEFLAEPIISIPGSKAWIVSVVDGGDKCCIPLESPDAIPVLLAGLDKLILDQRKLNKKFNLAVKAVGPGDKSQDYHTQIVQEK